MQDEDTRDSAYVTRGTLPAAVTQRGYQTDTQVDSHLVTEQTLTKQRPLNDSTAQGRSTPDG